MRDTNHKIDDETLNKVIAAAYKDAELADRVKVYFLIKKDAELKKIFNEYRTTADKIKNIHPDKCPDSVVKSLKISSSNEKKYFVFKPVYAVALSLVFVIITTTFLLFQKEDEPAYSKVEVEMAEEQVKASLAIVNKVFKKTENLIQDEVMPKRVGKPIHKSLTIINDVLTGG